MSDREFLLVTEYFHPDTASTGQLMTELAVGLRQRGLDVRVLTSQPNYHSGDNERQPYRDVHEGVPVRRIKAPQVRQASLARRLCNWAIFDVWVAAVLLVSSPDKEPEVLFPAITPGLSVLLSAVCRLRGWPYTYICYDLYPDQATELGYLKRGGVIDRIWGRLTAWSLRGAKRIVSNGPAMTERLIATANGALDPDKIALIHNWEDPEYIKPREKSDNWFSEEHDLVEPFVILYSGNISGFHDLETVVEAVAQIEDEVVFQVIGEGETKDEVVQRAEELGVRGEAVRFLPYQPYEDLPYSLTSGDVSLVTVRKGFEGVCVSSKLYTAMAAGDPVLTIAQPDDDETRIVREHDAGIQVEQGDAEGVVTAVRRWLDNPDLVERQGNNAREALETQYAKEVVLDEYYDLLTGAAATDETREATSMETEATTGGG
jgi:glycosyltransferase involved in cell wall biosynthesis